MFQRCHGGQHPESDDSKVSVETAAHFMCSSTILAMDTATVWRRRQVRAAAKSNTAAAVSKVKVGDGSLAVVKPGSTEAAASAGEPPPHDLAVCCHCVRLICFVVCHVPNESGCGGANSVDRMLLLLLELLRDAVAQFPSLPEPQQLSSFWSFLRNCIVPLQKHFNHAKTSEQANGKSAAHHLQRVDDLLHIIFEAREKKTRAL
jgi:hypothetical protein